jgi:ABC-type branched-subunit amino acid transport system substrate-binding protein
MFTDLRRGWAALAVVALIAFAVAGCGAAEVVEVPVEVTKVVTEQVEVEVTKVVTEQVEVTKVVTEEVPVEVTKVVTEQVEVTKVVEVEMEALEPLIVGHLNALTGSLSYFGDSHSNSISLAADHVNRAGGIQGGSVVLVHRDTGVNPVQGVAAAEELVNAQGVVAIVGALASGVTIPVATSVTVPNGVLQISGSSTAPGITVLEDNDFLFRTSLSDASQGVVLAELARELGYDSAGVLYINNAYGDGLTAQFEESFTASGGTLTAKVPHEDSQPTFVSELEKATEDDPDVLVAVSYQQAEVYLREALEGGYADTFLFVDGTKIPESFAVIGWDALEGSHGTGPGFESNPSTQAFVDAYEETYDVEPTHPFMNETYDAMVLIALAAAKAGSTTDSAAIRDSLRDVANAPGQVVGPGAEGIARALQLIAAGEDVNYEGAAGSVNLDENGDVISGHIEVWKIEGGEIVSVRQVAVDLSN